MLVSARNIFTQRDPEWKKYAEFIRNPKLTEVRSVDSMLNDYADPDADDFQGEVDEIRDLLKQASRKLTPTQYILIAFNLSVDEITELPQPTEFLGYELADEYLASTLLNCGPWEGKLAPFFERLNAYGLIQELKDAQAAQKLLPEVWGENHEHAKSDVWALYSYRPLH